MFDEDALTDRSMRFIAAEILREKIFRWWVMSCLMPPPL